jgi:hypothetical protein
MVSGYYSQLLRYLVSGYHFRPSHYLQFPSYYSATILAKATASILAYNRRYATYTSVFTELSRIVYLTQFKFNNKIYFSLVLTKWMNIVSPSSGQQPRDDVWCKGDTELRSIQYASLRNRTIYNLRLGKITEVIVLLHPRQSSTEN